MLDLSPIANAIKSVQAPPPQAQPSVTEEMKPVPQAEIENAVPPLPAKGGEPGLGEHLDLYDTQGGRNLPVVKDPRVSASAAETAASPDAAGEARAGAASTTEANADAAKADAAKKEKARPKTELLGNKTGLPQPTTDPIHLDLPFLKPLGADHLGKSVDARI